MDYDYERFRQLQTDKVNAAARKIIEKEYVSTDELYAILREFGVGMRYMDQMYQLDQCYVWIKEKTLEWNDFIRHLAYDVDFSKSGYMDYEKWSLKYRLNKETGMVDEYHQEYRYRIAYKKRSSINLVKDDMRKV